MPGPNLAHEISDDLHPCTHSVTQPYSPYGIANRTRQYDGRISAVPYDQQAPHPVEAALLEVQRLAGPSTALLACMCGLGTSAKRLKTRSGYPACMLRGSGEHPRFTCAKRPEVLRGTRHNVLAELRMRTVTQSKHLIPTSLADEMMPSDGAKRGE